MKRLKFKTFQLLNRNLNQSLIKSTKRYYSKTVSTSKDPENELEQIRNIGVIAHVDAGKTTTTERMLYYAGYTSNVGNVDDGNTVMDYMVQERERGITITSAAITFNWKDHRFNLIDTPGHIDFSFEVERSLRVLDGAITIVDASAGVEPQTITVWNQSNKYKIPRIAFLNKMDKTGASYESSLKSIESKLKTTPIPVQMPIGRERDFTGVVDLINMRKMTWPHTNNNNMGKTFKIEPLTSSDDLFTRARLERSQAIERLAQVSDEFGEVLLERFNMDFDQVNDPILIETYLRRACMSCNVTPILCGSALRNTGVQLLMDAVVKYLPNPSELEKNDFRSYYGSGLVAVCFKTIHDHQKLRKRVNNETSIASLDSVSATASALNKATKSEEVEEDVLSYVRVYNGELVSKAKIFNIGKQVRESCEKIYIPFANQLKSVGKISAGNIAVVNGLLKTTTGDFLVTNKHSYDSAKTKMTKKEEEMTSSESNHITDLTRMMNSIDVPPPVYFCTVEPQNESEEKRLKVALECLQREDPSLRVSFDDEDNQGQTILQGMGELQFEIVKDRLKREYNLNAYFGPLNIGYKEMATLRHQEEHTLKKDVGEKKISVNIALEVRPTNDGRDSTFKFIRIDRGTAENGLIDIPHEIQHAVNHGVESAINRGILLRYPMVNVDVCLNKLICSANVPLPYISNAAFICTMNALSKAECVVIQPVMKLEIRVPQEYSSRVHSDLNRRNCVSLTMSEMEKIVNIKAVVPLSKLNSYSSEFRKLSSGAGTFAIEFDSYQQLTQKEFNDLLNRKALK